MRYVMFILVTLALQAQVSMAKSEPSPAIGLAEGTPSAVNCPSGQYLAGFNVWSAPQISGFSPYCVAMQSDGQWQGVPQIHLESALSDVHQESVRVDMFCPRDHYAYGLAGLAQVYGIHGIVQLTVYCHNVKTGASMGLATQATPGISTTDWPAALCADTSVATGAFASARDAEILQLGLTCAQTKPAIAQARLLSATQSTSMAAAQPHRLGPGALIAEAPFNSAIRPTAPPTAQPAARATGTLDWSQSSRHPAAITATPASGASIQAAANSRLQQTGIIIVSGKPAAGARLASPVAPTPVYAPTAAASAPVPFTRPVPATLSTPTTPPAAATAPTMATTPAAAAISATATPMSAAATLPATAPTAAPATTPAAATTHSAAVATPSAAVKSGIIIVGGKSATKAKTSAADALRPALSLPAQAAPAH